MNHLREQWSKLADRTVLDDEGNVRWGNAAAGCLFYYHEVETDDFWFFLVHRSGHVLEPNTWGIPGGALMPGESPSDGALREFREECGFIASEATPQFTFTDTRAGWTYTTLVLEVDHKFTNVRLNWENVGFAWLRPQDFKKLPLHPGFYRSWRRVSGILGRRIGPNKL